MSKIDLAKSSAEWDDPPPPRRTPADVWAGRRHGKTLRETSAEWADDPAIPPDAGTVSLEKVKDIWDKLSTQAQVIICRIIDTDQAVQPDLDSEDRTEQMILELLGITGED